MTMIKKLLPTIFASLLLILVMTPVYAIDLNGPICNPDGDPATADAIDPVACAISGKDAAQSTVASIISDIVQTLVFIVGGLSVLMVVIGGLMYVLSGGDGNNTKRAKDAILYAIIGLVVALVAQGLVTFVISRI